MKYNIENNQIYITKEQAAKEQYKQNRNHSITYTIISITIFISLFFKNKIGMLILLPVIIISLFLAYKLIQRMNYLTTTYKLGYPIIELKAETEPINSQKDNHEHHIK